ncbi:hypothetical protein ACKFKG_02090 [Phormidesmis sp. 146-35]
MTSQKDQIQTLIHEIDAVLQKAASRLPWAASGQVAQQRQLLQRLRIYLMMQQRSTPVSQTSDSSQADAQQVMQSVVQEMNELRLGLLRPLQSEVATLTQQRNALIREIRRLEAHRQSYQTEQSASPSPSVEQIQKIQDQTNQALTTLDTTLKVVFESLQQDINAYQDSLAQGLDKLHHLGEQGEVMFSTLVNRLAEQLGREASSYLHAQEGEPTNLESTNSEAAPQPGKPVRSESIAVRYPQGVASTPISLPYPGTEIPSGPAQPLEAATGFASPALPPEETAISTNPAPLPLETPPHRDTINALTDLLEQLSADASQPLNVVSVSPPASDSAASDVRSLAEATYTPEENLLPTPPVSENPDLELTLDSTTLHQLSQDLSNLDKTREISSPTAPPIKSSTSSDSPAKINSVFNLEGMDDLFVEDAPPESES